MLCRSLLPDAPILQDKGKLRTKHHFLSMMLAINGKSFVESSLMPLCPLSLMLHRASGFKTILLLWGKKGSQLTNPRAEYWQEIKPKPMQKQTHCFLDICIGLKTSF
jgi:hypothetical protein